MLERIKFWWEERKIHKEFVARDDESAEQEYISELFWLDMLRRSDADWKLIKRARRYYIPIPPRTNKDGFWEEVPTEDGEMEWFLTEEGTNHLRRIIREEVNSSHERILKLIMSVTGLLGALIGLAAILSK